MKSSIQPIVYVEPLYLAREEAARFLALSVSQFEREVQSGGAPKPHKLSKGRVGWLVEELRAWGKARPLSDFLPPPAARPRMDKAAQPAAASDSR